MKDPYDWYTQNQGIQIQTHTLPDILKSKKIRKCFSIGTNSIPFIGSFTHGHAHPEYLRINLVHCCRFWKHRNCESLPEYTLQLY